MHTALLSTREAADRLGVSRYALHRLVRAGHLEPAQKFPGQTGAYAFDPKAVDALLKERAR